MSIEALTVALNSEVNDSTRKLILIGLANHAHRDGTTAFPSVKTLSHYARCSTRTVQRHLAALVEEGYIAEGDQRHVAHKPANQRQVVYDLAMNEEQRQEWLTAGGGAIRTAATEAGRRGGEKSAQVRRGDILTPQSTSAVDTTSPQVVGGDNLSPQDGATGGVTGGELGVTPVTVGGDTGVTQTVSNHPSNRPTPQRPPADAAVDGVLAFEDRAIELHEAEQERPGLTLVPPMVDARPTFDDFMAVYPRQDDKGRARKAWPKAIKAASPAAIIAGAERYRDDPNRHPSFTKQAATWLNAESWDNPPLPPRSDTTRQAMDLSFGRTAEAEAAPPPPAARRAPLSADDWFKD